MTSTSPFAHIESAPADPILGLTEAFLQDKHPTKVNLGVGVYQNEQGKVPLLDVVREAEARWLEAEETKTYLPIDGAPAYTREVQRLLFGADSPIVQEGRAVTLQALGGTGALRVGADFLRRFLPESQLWISDPSWENHRAVFEAAGFVVNTYAYYDAGLRGLNFGAMAESLRALPAGAVVVLHACCHNPTGSDLEPEQWKEVVSICAERGLVPFIDFAYQGFGRGIEDDARAVREFAASGMPFVVASSFSKSFSLYRERVGAFTLVAADAAEAKRALTQLKRVVRTNYSSPASHGAQVVALSLADEGLQAKWREELGAMRDRIHRMRALLVQGLAAAGVQQDFGFLQRQQGMFSYSGLPLDVVRKLRSDSGIYILDSGRMCVAAMNERNLDHICASIAQALQTS